MKFSRKNARAGKYASHCGAWPNTMPDGEMSEIENGIKRNWDPLYFISEQSQIYRFQNEEILALIDRVE